MRIKPSNRELRSIRLAKAKKIATHTKREWDLLKEFCNNTCVICGGSSGLINVEKDHITPIYQGGSDGIKNIQPACARCNASKGPDNSDCRPEGWEAYINALL